jgi:hypothetical protein
MTADTEAEDLQILDDMLKAVGPIKELVEIGPVRRDDKDGSVVCPITVSDIGKVAVDSIIKNVQGLAPTVKPVVAQGETLIYSGVCPGEENNPAPPPARPSAAEFFMGGDACWIDTAPSDWGTLAFAAHYIHIRDGAGTEFSVSNGCLGAGHVFGWQSKPGDLLSVPGHAQALRFVGALPVAGAARPIDAALASLNNVAQATRGSVRGFPMLQGVKAPKAGMWIAKNSAKSGVTAGLDEGPVVVQADGVIFKGVRRTTPGFACCHDSGAAVLDQNQKFVGLIFATQNAACALRPGAYYIPARKFGDPVNPLVHDLEIDITP